MTCASNNRQSLSSTAINISLIRTQPISSEKLSNVCINQPRNLIRNTSMANIGHRVENRKNLHNRLRLINNTMCFLGLFGIVLMIISNEIIFTIGNNEDTVVSWLLKLIISISTIILLGLIFYYHRLDLSLFCITNSFSHWRIGLTGTRIFLIALELLICSIHPIPRYYHPNSILNSTSTHSLSISYTSLDVALGLPMFIRLYLLCRFIKFHSPLVDNASSQSLGYLNQVSIDFFFLAKTYLEQWPTRCLLIFCTIVFFIGSWCLRACDYLPTGEHASMMDSMWLFIVTFTTVGYGDFTPSSYCGRSVTVIGSLVGIFATAILISVVAQKLIFTRWEKYVYNFVISIELATKRKSKAANVIKFAVKVWYLRRKNKANSFQFMKAQWDLFQSIHAVQELKREQRRLTDNCYTLADLLILQRDGICTTEKVMQQTNTMKTMMYKIEEKVCDMDQTINNIQNKLNTLLERIQ